MSMHIDHIGLVVPNIEAGIRHWARVFEYRQLTEVVINEIQKVKVVFLAKRGSLDVKLLEPVDPASPIARMGQKGGLHHLCFSCDDLDQEVARLRQEGLRVLVEPEPTVALEGGRMAFVFAKQGLSIELVDSRQRRALLDGKR